MSRKELKAYMNRTGKNKVDIASALKISPVTVERYLKGRPVIPMIEEGFRRLLAEEAATQSNQGPPPEAA